MAFPSSSRRRAMRVAFVLMATVALLISTIEAKVGLMGLFGKKSKDLPVETVPAEELIPATLDNESVLGGMKQLDEEELKKNVEGLLGGTQEWGEAGDVAEYPAPVVSKDNLDFSKTFVYGYSSLMASALAGAGYLVTKCPWTGSVAIGLAALSAYFLSQKLYGFDNKNATIFASLTGASLFLVLLLKHAPMFNAKKSTALRNTLGIAATSAILAGGAYLVNYWKGLPEVSTTTEPVKTADITAGVVATEPKNVADTKKPTTEDAGAKNNLDMVDGNISSPNAPQTEIPGPLHQSEQMKSMVGPLSSPSS